MSNPIALSFSRLSDFEQCPMKFEAKYIIKDYPDDSDNPAFKKGNMIHKMLEELVLHLRDEKDEPSLNSICKNAKPMIEKIYEACGGNMFPEKQVAVNQDWELCDWFAPPDVVKYRAIIDAIAFLSPTELLLMDYKSGKVREYEDGPRTQLKLTATIMFNLYPKIEKITTCYLFVEHKKTVSISFTRDQLPELQAPFDQAYEEVQNESEFAFRKNQYCRWCLLERCPVKVG